MNIEGQKKGSKENKAPGTKKMSFTIPLKKVKRFPQVPEWKKSEAFADVYSFIFTINEKVKGKKISANISKSQVIQEIVEMLNGMKALIKDIPPSKQEMRFGNKAFRTWHTQATINAKALMQNLLPTELVKAGACEELLVYLMDSFGSLQRIDYGTGHELNFVTWLAALYKIQILKPDDLLALAMVVFIAYLDLMRELQKVYWLEPAGSKGVWGLDDYQFLPFLWGASQLNGNAEDIQPSSIHEMDILQQYADDYLYLAAIKFIKEVKKGGHFYEHSPLLNDISQFPSWNKCNTHLIKMYDREVLGKFPVVQHFYFGTILPFTACPDTHPFKVFQKQMLEQRKKGKMKRIKITNKSKPPTITTTTSTTTTTETTIPVSTNSTDPISVKP